MKILILGHARHGKDTVADILCEKYNLKFVENSRSILELFLFDILKNIYKIYRISEYFTFSNKDILNK